MSSRSVSAEERALLHLGGALCCRRLPASEETVLIAEMNRLQHLIGEREVALPPRDKHPLPKLSLRLLAIASGLASAERHGPEYCAQMLSLRLEVQLSHLKNAERLMGRRIGQ